jgi:7-keto-8-aminopelargonate synthetase-like enzyme
MSRLPVPLRPVERTSVECRGRRLAYFGGCDYYRLATHPDVVAAAREALETHGFGVAAARGTTGNHPLYLELEAWLARFFRTERALLIGSGYAANPVVAQCLAGEVSHALLDENAHASLQDAARLLDCPTATFRHGDPEALQRCLRRLPRGAQPCVLTDGMFGRDGTVAPLAAYLDLLPAGGRLVVDEAHSAGVLGAGGRGAVELAGVTDARLIQTSTLSKAFGAFGGVVLAGARLTDRVIERSRWFAASTPIPLPAAAAALAAGRLIAADAAMRARLRAHATGVKSAWVPRQAGVPVDGVPILAVRPPTLSAAQRFRRALLQRGVHPPLIRYPGSPPGGYFRFAVSSEHTPDQLAALRETLARFAAEFRAQEP